MLGLSPTYVRVYRISNGKGELARRRDVVEAVFKKGKQDCMGMSASGVTKQRNMVGVALGRNK